MLLILVAISLLASACGVHTRAAIKNDTGSPIDVKLTDGDETVTYAAIPAGTTSAFEKVSFSVWTQIQVIVGTETRRVDLNAEKDNTIVVGKDGASVEATYNPENEWW